MKKVMMGLAAIPSAIACTWVGARVVAAIGAVVFAVQMAVGKLVLIGVASALGIAFAHAAHAQGNAGFIYARDRSGHEQLVYADLYHELGRFGSDMIMLGRATDAGVRAVLESEQGQQYITFALTADPNSPGKDLVNATLESRNNYQTPTVVQVYVSAFGGSLIGQVAAGLFANSGNNGGTIYHILQYAPLRLVQDGPVTQRAREREWFYRTQRASNTNFQHALALVRSPQFQH